MDEMATPLMPAVDRSLRIVFEHKKGPWKGLREIVGRSNDLPNTGEKLPSTEGPFNARPDNRQAMAGLVAVDRGYALYREIDTPVMSFDPRQR